MPFKKAEDDLMRVPEKFFGSLSDDEMMSIYHRGGLDKDLCLRLWHMAGRNDEAPEFVKLVFSVADLEKCFPGISKY